MDIISQKPQGSSSQTDKEEETAVPYTPPPPPDDRQQKKFRSPVTNALMVVGVILLGGYMSYNYFGHQLTDLSASSTEIISTPTPTPSPTITHIP